MVLGLLRGDPALVDQLLHEGVVLGDLGERAVAQQVAAGVADVGQRQLVAGAQHRDRRWCPCPSQLGVVLHRLAQARRWPRAGCCRAAGRASSPPWLSPSRWTSSPDDQRAGDVAGGVAAHAVGDDEQVRPGIRRSPRCGSCGPARRRSGRRSAGRWPSGLLPQLEDGLADPQGGADLDRDRVGEAVAAEVGAVGGAEVLDEPALGALEDAGVPAGGEVVVEDERALGVAADRTPAAAAAATCRPAGPR